jgi:hypothetical protein
MLFVRMLIIILQRIQRSIQAKEACPPAITAASSVTSDSSVHSSRLKSQRSCQQELYQALYLLRHFRLHGISSSLFLPIKVANQRRTNQGATRGSRRQDMLRSMANMDMTSKPSPRVKQVWVKKDETIHPMRGNERT